MDSKYVRKTVKHNFIPVCYYDIVFSHFSYSFLELSVNDMRNEIENSKISSYLSFSWICINKSPVSKLIGDFVCITCIYM